MSKEKISLQNLSRVLDVRLKDALPGPLAHNIMRARATGELRPRFEHTSAPRMGSVLILLYEQDGIVRFPLIRRPVYRGVHSGQVSLPGGKAEPGENLVDTALREGEEEIGVPRQGLTILGRLSNFHVLPSNFLITPVVAATETLPVFIPDPYEVDRVLSGNVEDLLREDAIKETEILVGEKYKMSAPHFVIDGEIVWGATAMILNEFRSVVKELL